MYTAVEITAAGTLCYTSISFSCKSKCKQGSKYKRTLKELSRASFNEAETFQKIGNHARIRRIETHPVGWCYRSESLLGRCVGEAPEKR